MQAKRKTVAKLYTDLINMLINDEPVKIFDYESGELREETRQL